MKTFLEFFDRSKRRRELASIIKAYTKDKETLKGDPRYDNASDVQTNLATPPPSSEVTATSSRIDVQDLPPPPGSSGALNKKVGPRSYPERTVTHYVPDVEKPTKNQRPVKQQEKPNDDSEWGPIKTDPAGRKYRISKDRERTQFLTGKQGSKGTKAGTTPFKRNLGSDRSDRRSRSDRSDRRSRSDRSDRRSRSDRSDRRSRSDRRR